MTVPCVLATALVIATATMAEQLPDIRTIPQDLTTPEMTVGAPGPGKRVRQTLPAYEGTGVHHALYLPTDWREGKRFPVLVEYAGNGPFSNKHGDTCTGKVGDCNLGYGISGGTGFVWVCVPYVATDGKHHQLQWWGDVEATVEYCKQAVRLVCDQYGGDPTKAILCGFSRGAIACNYLGLHDDEIAALWCGFICHSHYDGVRMWGHADSDRAPALERLHRLNGRPQFISHEGSASATEDYLRSTDVEAPLTFVPIPYRNHTDTWVLRDIPERRKLRAWVAALLQGKQ